MPAGATSDAAAPRFTNRLAKETSPYLLQHAHNPVDWYPWGEEAFEKARREDKPLFVSIGYSTCYWCHVMERESFEDEATARVMNERFVCIKIDREERPDVDEICMTACMLATGSGGWPLNVALTPPEPAQRDANTKHQGQGAAESWRGLQPFWAGTYFPNRPAFSRPSFLQVLDQLHHAWTNEREATLRQAGQIALSIARRLSEQRAPTPVGAEEIGQAAAYLLRLHDGENGGFGGAPKFPQPVFCQFLLEVRDAVNEEARRTQIDEALSMTLDRMAMGGMYDQIGGGFHRYSTDALWLVPHFEKMLYDNGQLAALYAQAARAAGGDAFYSEVATEICDYVLREMTDPATGAFYSAQDAEVNHREGLNYLWMREEVVEALGAAGAEAPLIEFALDVYGLNAGPNFQDPHHLEDEMQNVIFLTRHPGRLAEEMNLSRTEVDRRLRRVNEILLRKRDQREQPGTDDKILAGWNGLMITGLAEVGSVLNRPKYVDAAKRAWSFIDRVMRDPQSGDLLRVYRAGEAKVRAFAEDYAFLAQGMLTLYRATNETERDLLDAAARLMTDARARFWDTDRGGYFDTRPGQSEFFIRSKSVTDGAVPAANSIMLHNLIDLYRLTSEHQWAETAAATLRSLSATMHRNAIATINSTRALLIIMSTMPEILEMMASVSGRRGMAATAGGSDADRSGRASAPHPHPPHTDGVLDEPNGWAADLNHEPPAPAGLQSNEASSARAVTVRASTDILELDGHGSEPKTVIIMLDVTPGFHLNAHDPGVDGLVGLDLIMHGPHADAFALDIGWPEGETFKPGASGGGGGGGGGGGVDAGADDAIRVRVYDGPTAIPVRIGWADHLTAEDVHNFRSAWKEHPPRLFARLQACTRHECLAPVELEIPLTIETAGAGDGG